MVANAKKRSEPKAVFAVFPILEKIKLKFQTFKCAMIRAHFSRVSVSPDCELVALLEDDSGMEVTMRFTMVDFLPSSRS